ncbi:hypothetical protein NYE70_25300 [Paenibacillus sp. FSL R5-0407]|uniref:hypothetical protein n=1 Tax=Paenibacillus TaxID=44249 RepID=UPI0025B6794A|nr:hypothetical protein [Paenibacillus vini]MDN4070587.1 hypothetical protein [Paenibacillus vini]
MAILILTALTSCTSTKPHDLSGVPEEIQLLDTDTGQVFYLGMEKSQIHSKKLVKSDEFSDRSEFFDTYLYEGVNMLFYNDKLIFMQVKDTSPKGRFKMRGLELGSSVDEMREVYGNETTYSHFSNSYSYMILNEGEFYYFKSIAEYMGQATAESSLYILNFVMDGDNRIERFSIFNEKFVDVDLQ